MKTMIRQAENKDIDDVLRLLAQVNDVHAAGRPDLFIKGHTKYSATELRQIFADPTTPVFVDVDKEGHVLGYCFCVIQDNTGSRHLQQIKTLYIDDLCVDQDVRGKGVGKRLYEYVTEYGHRQGCHNLTLSVWECNRDAMGFYRRMGLVTQKTYLEAIL